MKEEIHLQYYPEATIKCACGKSFSIGTTVPSLQTEICSNCHPFYTGKDKVIDTQGRIERFKDRLEKSKEKAVTLKASKIKKVKRANKLTKEKAPKKSVKK
ncbi:MAG: 50S ribosomal protein L31 [Candidatus Yanofskybacteria bacterium CG10_big_fil_rev_8_21_14_0_10_46_23]|uniref:Large ribosomal subunit protein bL31 n=1 Tax=Candidatus Yanofskybacteria bacterium CG10_big_fil_rev_8_21_14_0_10_46_23 TaxID=1975098 RepID=A0A2H0R455_9BACT|nr:MAG: 50S ribosomal protein L31 [Candidatus Yanofskybacteria bacterium CG10_big_fil_rev_8_21_14_0_10_46_23]